MIPVPGPGIGSPIGSGSRPGLGSGGGGGSPIGAGSRTGGSAGAGGSPIGAGSRGRFGSGSGSGSGSWIGTGERSGCGSVTGPVGLPGSSTGAGGAPGSGAEATTPRGPLIRATIAASIASPADTALSILASASAPSTGAGLGAGALAASGAGSGTSATTGLALSALSPSVGEVTGIALVSVTSTDERNLFTAALIDGTCFSSQPASWRNPPVSPPKSSNLLTSTGPGLLVLVLHASPTASGSSRRGPW